MDADDPRHGTVNGYVHHRCRCQPCRDAWAPYFLKQTDQRTGTLAADDPRHGKISTYNNYRCRCEACRAAKSAYQRKPSGSGGRP